MNSREESYKAYLAEREADDFCENAHYAFKRYMCLIGSAARKHRQSAINQVERDFDKSGGVVLAARNRLKAHVPSVHKIVMNDFIDKCIDVSKINPETGCPFPVAEGFRHDEDSGGYAWALFRVEDLPSDLSTDQDTLALAVALTGWCRWYKGPGRSFGHDPYVAKKTKTRILVKQFRGLDI